MGDEIQYLQSILKLVNNMEHSFIDKTHDFITNIRQDLKVINQGSNSEISIKNNEIKIDENARDKNESISTQFKTHTEWMKAIEDLVEMESDFIYHPIIIESDNQVADKGHRIKPLSSIVPNNIISNKNYIHTAEIDNSIPTPKFDKLSRKFRIKTNHPSLAPTDSKPLPSVELNSIPPEHDHPISSLEPSSSSKEQTLPSPLIHLKLFKLLLRREHEAKVSKAVHLVKCFFIWKYELLAIDFQLKLSLKSKSEQEKKILQEKLKCESMKRRAVQYEAALNQMRMENELRVKELESEIKSCRVILNEKELVMRELNERLLALEEALMLKDKQLSDLQSKEEMKSDMVSEKEGKMAMELSYHQTRLVANESMLTELRKELKRINGLHEVQRQEVQRLMEEIQSVREETKRELEGSERALKDAKREIGLEREALAAKEVGWLDRLHGLEEELDRTGRKEKDWMEAMDGLKGRLHDEMQLRLAKESELREMEGRWVQLTELKERLEGKWKRWKGCWMESEKEKEAFRIERDGLLTQLTSQQDIVRELSDRMKSLHEWIRRYKEHPSRSSEDKAKGLALERDHRMLCDRVEGLQRDVERLEKEGKELRQQVEEGKGREQSLSLAIKVKDAMLSDQVNEIASIKKRIHSMERHLAEREEGFHELEGQYQEEREEVEVRREELEGRMNELEEKLRKKGEIVRQLRWLIKKFIDAEVKMLQPSNTSNPSNVSNVSNVSSGADETRMENDVSNDDH